MADVELVIKIPKEVYKSIINDKNYISYREYVEEAIKNATSLPKGHGRIMDVDRIIKKMEEREECLKDDRSMYETACVETALDMFGETIIKADKAESDAPDFESEKYVEKRVENYTKMLKSGILDCVIHESVDESEG